VRFDVYPPGANDTTVVRWIELSPDGRHLAFSTTLPSRAIFVRSLDAPTVRLLADADVAGGLDASAAQSLRSAAPFFFWSPDGQFIAFFSEGKLKRVPAGGGPAHVICNLPPALNYTGTWSKDGVILFGAGTQEGTTIWRVAAAGGQPALLHESKAATPDQAFFPIFLPDGRHYLAMAPKDARTSEAFVGELESTERQPLPGVMSSPRYSSAGYLLFVRQGSLVAQPFDVDRLQLTGEPVSVVENLVDAVGQFSASMTGALAYRTAGGLGESPLVSFDRAGRQRRSESLTGRLQAPSLSRDGRRVAIERTNASGTDVWTIDLVRGTHTRLTDDAAPDTRPVFSPDGAKVAFTKGGAIYLKSSSGTGTEDRLIEGEVTDWSPDGRFISFIRNGDLWAVAVDGERTPMPIAQTKNNDRRGRFSPDGKWIAYESDFSGRFEIYVQRFPPTADRVQVSVNGGGSAYWRADGKELFFSVTDQSIMAVDVTPGASFQVGTPHKLFDVPGLIHNGRFVVTADGQQLLVPLQKPEPLPITVVLNWAAGLNK
jgi:Tol biopolymer transport system component